MSFLRTTDLQRIFQELDKNGDGFISVDQLQCLLDKIGHSHDQTKSADELQKLFGGKPLLDSIDFYFFYKYVILNNVVENEGSKLDGDEGDDDLMKAFKVFDLNGDGFISCEELQSVLLRLGLWDQNNGQDCQIMINMYDKNSDGMLDFEEFKFMMLLSKF
ncbi:OLC1v1016457C1 [Oldenlandia corymbosa var. corymbosa]|uniref:OLC1v1016457C1 n=1 Tax=Oldenlandia corymbosa var. corymbosa TaxID=529605 RepID=A0AAV1E5H3_OLDCO|nr:OLC1v1016457C1 [Oldenlandia corymbosa var. corymbosa]